jgi:capsular polysaccharide biosynthesis protein
LADFILELGSEPPVGSTLTDMIDAGAVVASVQVAGASDLERRDFFCDDRGRTHGAKFGPLFFDPAFRQYRARSVSVCRLADATVVGTDGVVITNGSVIRDTLNHISSWEPTSLTAEFRASQYLKLRRPITVSSYLDGRPYFIGFAPSWRNYAHWLQESLPKLVGYIRLRPQLPTMKLVVPAFAADSFQAQTLTLLGIGPEDIFEIPYDQCMTFADAFVTTAFDIWSISPHLRDVAGVLASHVTHQILEPAKRIFIHRAGHSRSLANFPQIATILAKYGFKTVMFEGMPLSEQIAVMRPAEYIIAEHGAGIANVLFCENAPRLLELFNPACVQPAFWSLASCCGIGHGFIVGDHVPSEERPNVDWNANYAIGAQRMEQAIDAMLHRTSDLPSLSLDDDQPGGADLPDDDARSDQPAPVQGRFAAGSETTPNVPEFDDLGSVAHFYADRPDVHRAIYDAFTASVARSPHLCGHRQRIEKDHLGFGDTPFHWFWHLLVKALPDEFKFIEIGVFKGQVISLISMLALRAGKTGRVYGVTPLSNAGDKFSSYPDDDYASAIDEIQEWTGIPASARAHIIAGLSTDDDIKLAARTVAPFDVVYIDGGHDYATVVNDLNAFGDMLGVGGYLVMSDGATELSLPTGIWPGHPDVGRAIHDVVDPDLRWSPLCSVGHLRVWRKTAQVRLLTGATGTHARVPAARKVDKRDLVLGFCTNYSFDVIEPFIASALALGDHVELCLLARNLDARFHEVAVRHGIRVEDAAPYMKMELAPLSSRYFGYRDFLRREASSYRSVLLTDVRDVYFQSDPFAIRHPKAVCFALEDTKIMWEKLNQSWVRDVYGEDVLQTIAANHVTCAGTLIGTTEGILTYLDLLCAELSDRAYDRSRSYDQGIHNYILWKLQPEWAWADTTDTIMNTLGCTGAERIELIDGLTVVDGKVPAVIHQWDRHEHLRNHVQTSAQFKLRD